MGSDRVSGIPKCGCQEISVKAEVKAEDEQESIVKDKVQHIGLVVVK